MDSHSLEIWMNGWGIDEKNNRIVWGTCVNSNLWVKTDNKERE